MNANYPNLNKIQQFAYSYEINFFFSSKGSKTEQNGTLRTALQVPRAVQIVGIIGRIVGWLDEAVAVHGTPTQRYKGNCLIIFKN
jgi:hypothetical protein